MPHYKVRRRGSATVEFVLVGAFFLVPLILGLMSVGFALSRSLQVAQLTRDVGRMQVRGIDFSQTPNQELITGSASRPNLPPLARGLGMVGNGATRNATGGTTGNGELVLSVMTRVLRELRMHECGPNRCHQAHRGREQKPRDERLRKSDFLID